MLVDPSDIYFEPNNLYPCQAIIDTLVNSGWPLEMSIPVQRQLNSDGKFVAIGGFRRAKLLPQLLKKYPNMQIPVYFV